MSEISEKTIVAHEQTLNAMANVNAVDGFDPCLVTACYRDEEGNLYDATWKRYIETAAKDLVPKEGLSNDKYAAVCRCVEEKLYIIIYRTAVLLKNHPEKLSMTCNIKIDIYNFSKIMFNEMLAAGIPAVCGA